jgi:hypothetical protein
MTFDSAEKPPQQSISPALVPSRARIEASKTGGYGHILWRLVARRVFDTREKRPWVVEPATILATGTG